MQKFSHFVLGGLVATSAFVGCKQEEKSGVSTITVQVTDSVSTKSPLVFLPNGDQIEVKLANDGSGKVEFNHQGSLYVKLSYNYISRLVWLTPNSNVAVSFNSNDFYKHVDFTGSNEAVNTYLNSKPYTYTEINDCELPESTFIAKGDSLLAVNLATLKGADLPKEFVTDETNRLVYATWEALPTFAYYHARINKLDSFEATELFWNKLNDLTTEDAPHLKKNEDYQNFLSASVSRLAKKHTTGNTAIERLTEYISANVKDSAVMEFLINRSAYNYVERYGLKDAENHKKAFDTYVKDAELINKFNALCAKWAKCAEGAQSPDFNCTDAQGNQYTLEQFKGKYVYIDIWATWCGPCKKEMPHLAQLEEKYHGKDIHFVGLSCDRSKEDWMNSVGSLKGVQLYLEPGNTFMDDYMISGIPRFILLDREGKIISNDMTRPSDPATAAKIDELLAL